MGLYSTNRINSVAEAVEEPVVEATVEEVINFEECATEDVSMHSMLEHVIGLHENEAKMFDSLLELDFVSATNEATMLESEALALNEAADESKIKAIKAKIAELWENLKKAVTGAFAKLTEKVKQLFDFDAKVVKHYEEAIKKADFKDFQGIKNFALPNKLVSKDMINEVLLDSTPLEQKLNLVDANDVSAIDGIIAEYKKMQKDAKFYHEHFMKEAFGKVEETWKPSSSDASDIVSKVKNNKQFVDGIKAAGNAVIGTVKDMAKKYAAEKKEAKKAGYAFEARIHAAQYTLALANAKDISLCVNAAVKVAAQQAATYRKAMVVLGTYAIKASGAKEATNESVNMFVEAVELSVDNYIANVLEY